MCIICVSRAGIRQPTEAQIRTMFARNPHGAGYMFARDGVVTIHKGFMDIDTFLDALESERFTTRDSVVYHFRISTQAGVGPEMTHPFPLTDALPMTRELDVQCDFGVAHNGVIRLTSDPNNTMYSDTAIFIAQYLARIIREPGHLRSQAVRDRIHRLAWSKFAIMDKNGYVATVGEFIRDRGLLFSNHTYTEPLRKTRPARLWDDLPDDFWAGTTR